MMNGQVIVERAQLNVEFVKPARQNSTMTQLNRKADLGFYLEMVLAKYSQQSEIEA